MPAEKVVPVVLPLPGIHNALLGKVCGRAESEIGAGIIEGDICQRLVQLGGRRKRVANAIAAKFYVQAPERDARFIDHMRAKVVRPTGENGLSQRRFIEWVARGCALSAVVQVEESVAVVNITSNNRVATNLQV